MAALDEQMKNMTGEKAIEWIHSRRPFGSRPGLDRVEALLERLGNPEKKIQTIHIAGTNGKGSTVSCLRSMLEESGLTVGTYTSPYIELFNERIAIDKVPISEADLVYWVEKIQPLVEELDQIEAVSGITEFEVLTAMAFDYFYEKKVDVAIIEVGLGGLLDSTNVIVPVLTGITTIGMDHTEILGDTLEKIAEQKAGIIKHQVPVVTGNIVKEAQAVIEQQAKKLQAPLYKLGRDYHVTYKHPSESWGELFDFENERGKQKSLQTPLLGRYQTENAGLAIQLYSLYCQYTGLPFQEKNVKNGLKKTSWPARMEKISTEPLIVLDGAHNSHAIARLVDTLTNEFSNYRIKILFSALETKDVKGMLEQLLTIPQAEIFLTTFDYPKAIRLSENYDEMDEKRISVVSLWQFGLAELLEKMTADDLLLITGSLYFVSEVRQLLMDMGGKND